MALISDSSVPDGHVTPVGAKRLRPKRLRLSWPHAGDGRRAIVGKSPSHKGGGRPISDARLVHVSFWDVQMHYHLTRSALKGRDRPTLRIPVCWSPFKLQVGNKDLFQYFQYAASHSLATFGYDPHSLGNVLTRIALASNTPSATAVLHSLLALASLHRHGVQAQAVELKISALKALSSVSADQIGTMEAIQHVAAGMLLCSFEIHQASCTSGQWAWYIRGVKEVINAAHLSDLHQDKDMAVVLDWVSYHDVLARFTLRHWQGQESMRASSPASTESPSSSVCTEIFDTTPSLSFPALGLLSAVCDAVSARPPDTGAVENLDDYRSFLKVLDWRIRCLPISTVAGDASAALLDELYQLAMLVYLNRATGDLLGQAAKTQQQIDRGFSIFTQLSSCERQFPVFILGCEARTDEQRAVVLDLIARTEKKVSSRSFNFVRLLIQAIWAQEDLSDGEINYWDKLSSIIGCCSIMPTFV
ncbi:hypothetical protein GGS23DRAFT_590628 [Durotheca rogersii]|uniref:uncharacterized protein n=1 Tax=Durotheca rogersii TaxID=419775 RepID=UPI002220473C|nr:uncharacterized protein GGS23DRAFT_590628 [Durotheca rogersii]KAI5854500.1 hypothetical protein GGS23DRAFT_590628 [Durotheca rogersii]